MIAAIVQSDEVARKTFFLEMFNTPLIMNLIRGAAAALVIFILVYYWRHGRD